MHVVQAYEVVEEEATKAERARAQAKRAKDVMEGQMLQVCDTGTALSEHVTLSNKAL